MGVHKNAKDEARDRKRPHSRSKGAAEYRELDGAALVRCLARIAEAGGAIRFGYTRDGGAFNIGVYGLGDPYTEYMRPGDDVIGFLEEVAQELVAEAEKAPAPEHQDRLPGT